MPWRKDRPYTSGELEFHLTGEPEAANAGKHDETWIQQRLDKLQRRHST